MTHIVYKKLRLQNTYSYKECDLDLQDQGLVFVRGLNVDDGGFLGAGKSSLFEAFSVLQMGKGGKNTTLSDMVNHDAGKDMEAVLWLSVDGKDYKLILHQKHSQFGNGLKAIDLDTGKNVIPMRNATHAPKYVREVLLKTLDTTFFHLTYLAQRMTNVLLTGTDAQRKHQITEMFDLHVYDQLAKYIDTQTKLAETDLRRLDALEEELRLVQSLIKDSPPVESLNKSVRSRKKDLQAGSVSLEASIQELRDVEAELEQSKRRARTRKSVLQIWEDTPLLRKDMDKPTGCTRKYINRQRTRLAKAQEAFAATKEAIQQLDRRHVLEQQLNKLSGVTINAEDVNENLTIIKTKLSHLQNVELPQAETRQEILKGMQQLHLPDMELEEAVEKLEELKTQKTLEMSAIKAYSSQLEGDVCPTCKRPYDRSVQEIKETETLLKQKRKDFKKTQKDLHLYEGYVTDLRKYKDYETRLGENSTKRRPKSIQAEILELTATERELSQQLDGANRKGVLEKQLQVMPKGSAADLRKEQRRAQGRKERAEVKLDAAKRINTELLKLKKLPKKPTRKLKRKLTRLETLIQTLTQDLSTLSEALATAKSDLRVITDSISREAKLTTQLKKVRGLVDKHECYKALKIAFGQKGLKHDRLHSIMKEAAERTVPLYSNILWPNRNVSLDLEPAANAIRFQLSRGKFDVGTSSRAISGGESHKAGLSFLFGLRDLKEIYTSYSSNVLILDEPFSHLDPQGKVALLQVLQMLKSKFSSIFVVSHLTEVVNNDAWDQVWWAIRENNESTLYKKEPPAKYLKLSQRYEEELDT